MPTQPVKMAYMTPYGGMKSQKKVFENNAIVSV